MLWAIREAALSEREVAEHLKVDPSLVHAWIAEEARPNQTQARKLAALLDRPLATFLLPEPPPGFSAEVAFRSAPGLRRALKPNEADALRRAKRAQEIAAEIHEELAEEEPDLPLIDADAGPGGVAGERERNRIGGVTTTPWTLASARAIVEAQGILVLQFQLGPDASRGFSLWDSRTPLIALNQSYGETARIFTLFHEYAHLLTRTDSICTAVALPSAASDVTERWCEGFASGFLLPSPELRLHLEEYGWDGTQVRQWSIDEIRSIADRYGVSYRATALRLIAIGAADPSLYYSVDRAFPVTERSPQQGGLGERRPAVRIRSYGPRLNTLLVRGLDRGVIAPHELHDYFGVSQADLRELRERLSTHQE